MGKRVLDILCEKIAEKLFERYAEQLRGHPGKDGKPGPVGPSGISGLNGPEGRAGRDGYDPFRIGLNEEVIELSWQGVSFIIPFNSRKYPDVESGELSENDLKYIQAVHPELFEKIVLFWYRDYQFQKGKQVIWSKTL